MTDVFDELESAVDETADEKEEAKAEKEGRAKSKYFIVQVTYVAENQKELREYLEENDDVVKSHRIVKGFEILPKRKVAYVF
jgi:hypothetical protein